MTEPVLNTIFTQIEVMLNRPMTPHERDHAERELNASAMVIESQIVTIARRYYEKRFQQ
jgi:ABC-type enterochelin transport system permease subunit